MPANPCDPGCRCGLHPLDNVPVDPFREAVADLRPHQLAEVARAAGFVRPRPGRSGRMYICAETHELKRAVGLAPSCAGGRYKSIRSTIPYDIAVRLADALGLDPVDAGV